MRFLMFGHVFNLLAAYVEDQLDTASRERVERHLAQCQRCRRSLETIRAGVQVARALSPKPMPDAVVRSIEVALAGTPTFVPRTHARVWTAGRVAAVAVAVAAIGVTAVWHVNRPWIRLAPALVEPNSYEADGRLLHQQLQSGDASLRFESNDDGRLWAWLASQGAPVTEMRVVRPDVDRARFEPRGATVATIGGARASVLSYRIGGRPVTLTLAHQRDVASAPDAGWWSKQVFHRAGPGAASTLTWTVGGGTYVLVSEVGDYGQDACRICHTSPRFAERLKQLSIRSWPDRQ